MNPAYTKHVEIKAWKFEATLNYAVKRLREIINKYDLPFNSEEHKQMIAELSRLKLLLEYENHQNDISTD
jgi:hypothetical protein